MTTNQGGWSNQLLVLESRRSGTRRGSLACHSSLRGASTEPPGSVKLPRGRDFKMKGRPPFLSQRSSARDLTPAPASGAEGEMISTQQMQTLVNVLSPHLASFDLCTPQALTPSPRQCDPGERSSRAAPAGRQGSDRRYLCLSRSPRAVPARRCCRSASEDHGQGQPPGARDHLPSAPAPRAIYSRIGGRGTCHYDSAGGLRDGGARHCADQIARGVERRVHRCSRTDRKSRTGTLPGQTRSCWPQICIRTRPALVGAFGKASPPGVLLCRFSCLSAGELPQPQNLPPPTCHRPPSPDKQGTDASRTVYINARVRGRPG